MDLPNPMLIGIIFRRIKGSIMEWISVDVEIPINAKKVLMINRVGIIDCGWIELSKDGRVICRTFIYR